jgi:hypothetical protein
LLLGSESHSRNSHLDHNPGNRDDGPDFAQRCAG